MLKYAIMFLWLVVRILLEQLFHHTNFPKEELENWIGRLFTSWKARDNLWTRPNERGHFYNEQNASSISRNEQKLLQFSWLSMDIQVWLKSTSIHTIKVLKLSCCVCLHTALIDPSSSAWRLWTIEHILQSWCFGLVQNASRTFC